MSIQLREERLDALRKNKNPDVLVVGGGINGIGVYRDLALQGVNVVLVERDDYCSGASAALSRMIHGGLRYLENGEFQLVKESLQERNLLLKNAPHYVSPLSTVIPVFEYFSGISGAIAKFLRLSDKPTRRGALIVKTGLALYDFFTRNDQVMPKHEFFGRRKTLQAWPDFPPSIKCSATYYDASVTYPERLGLEMITDIEQTNSDALAFNYMNVDGSDGKSVLVTDIQSLEQFVVTPKVIVNATGAWIDFTNGVLSKSSDNKVTGLVGGTKGSHLIIKNEALLKAVGNQMVYFENEEGRVCVLFSYFGNVLVGSTDIKLDNPEGNRCEEFERDYILESLAFIFPDIKIDPSEIVFAFSGVRPLINSNNSTTGQISRDHYCQIVSEEEGFAIPVLCMIGGKWTTFRAFSEQAADQILNQLGVSRSIATDDIPIGGGRDFPTENNSFDHWISAISKRTNASVERVRLLAQRYGSKSEKILSYLNGGKDIELKTLPTYTRAEIEYIIDNEHVVSLGDIFFRRTSIAISGEISLALINEIASILSTKLGWNVTRKKAECEELLSRLSTYHGLSKENLRSRNFT